MPRATVGAILDLLHDDDRAQRCVLADRLSAVWLPTMTGVAAVVHVEHPLGRALHGARAGDVRLYLAAGRVRSVRLAAVDERS